MCIQLKPYENVTVKPIICCYTWRYYIQYTLFLFIQQADYICILAEEVLKIQRNLRIVLWAERDLWQQFIARIRAA